jgi:predicted amidophosphoribosyltransferase
MNRIKSLEEGIADLLSTFSPEDIMLVEIPSRTPGFKYSEDLLYCFRRKGLEIPPERRVTYIPPDSVSRRNFAERVHIGYAPHRVEQIPKTEDVHKAYIIIDDSIESGATLACAVKALEGQGVPRRNIWFSAISGPLANQTSGILFDNVEAYVPFAPKLAEMLR